VIENVPAAINFKDADLRFVFVNDACARFFRHPGEWMIGKRLSDLTSHIDIPSLEAGDRRVLASGKAEPQRIVLGISPEGRAETWWTIKVPARDQDGNIIGVVTISQDVSELMEAQSDLQRTSSALVEANRELQQQARRLEELNVQYLQEREGAIQASRAKSEFLANMSHELRTPLNAVIGFSDIMVRMTFGAISPRYLEYARDIQSSGQRLLEIINDILDMSRIESGNYDLQLSRTDLRELSEFAANLARGRAAEKDQRIHLSIQPDVPPVLVDAKAIKSVITNLLSNAVKFTQKGGFIELLVKRVDDGWIEISVGDNGPGIPREQLEHVFKAFWQAEEARSRSHEGTGLGLSICRKFVELHGGTISIDSERGRGTKVTVRLPIG